MRPIPSRLLPHTAAVTRPTRSDTGSGGWTESYASVATGVKCRAAVISSPTELDIAAAQYGEVTGKVAFPAGQNIRRGDRLSVVTQQRTIAYEVRGIVDPSEAGVYRLAYVREEPRQGTV